MTNEPTVTLPSEADIDGLFKQFRSLNEHAALLIFPENTLWLDWLKNDPGSNSLLQKWLVGLTNSWLGNLYWFLASLLSSYLSYYIALSVSGTPLPSGASQGTSGGSQALAIFVLLVSLFANVLAYSRLWVFLFRDNRYLPKPRLILAFIILTLSAAIVWGMARSTGAGTIGYWFPVWVVAVIPTCILAVIVVIHSLVKIAVFASKLVFFHEPEFDKKIRQLILEPIPSSDGEWRLITMDKAERDLLKQWTLASRDNAEKRFWPTVIFVAAIGVLVDAATNTPAFQDTYNAVITMLESAWHALQLQVNAPAPTPNIWLILGILVVVTVVVWFVNILGILLRAMLVRGLILEACEWAEHYYQKGQPARTEPIPDTPGITKLLKSITDLFIR